MSIARHHNEWLSLLEISGPFLSMPVLLRAFPQGLDAHDPEIARSLRMAYDEWADNQQGLRPDPAIHAAWVRFMLRHILGFADELLLSGPAIPEALKATVAEQGEVLRPDLIVQRAGSLPRLLVQILPPEQHLDKPLKERRWKASPATRMADLLRATGVNLGIVTNGERWMLVHAQADQTAGFISWYAALWLDEPVTLRAFCSLLGIYRTFGVPDDDTLPALLTESAAHQHEVTDQLGYQVRQAVEVLVQTLDRIDKDSGRTLLDGIKEPTLYEAVLTVMMRLVFLFSAEERGLLLLGKPMYDQHYAISTLRAQLHEAAEQSGEEVLERRCDAWSRLLVTFRAVHAGVQHEDMRLPAYGGSLFDPDRFPFLEGRGPNTAWHITQAQPLAIDNRTVLHLLEALQILRISMPGGGPAEPRRLSFRALDVEQIGHVYEGLLDHTVKRAAGPVLGLIGTKDREPEIPLAALETLLLMRNKPIGLQISQTNFLDIDQGAVAPAESESLLIFLHDATGRSNNALINLLQAAVNRPDRAALLSACDNDQNLFEQVLPFIGILRRDSFGRFVVINTGSVYVTAGTDRRNSGTHYTPRSLTEPIVKHTLEPLVYDGPAEGKAKEDWTLHSAERILSLKVCDMAMGSGAFLVQACRYLSEHLVQACEASVSIDHPDAAIAMLCTLGDVEDRLAFARQLVSDRCLYGVDKNALAVEMAKLSLWLITVQKDRAFTFLDHALRCGDALLGVINIDQITHWDLKRKSAGTAVFTQLHLIKQQVEYALDIALSRRYLVRHTPVFIARQAEEKVGLLAEANREMALVRLGADLLLAGALVKDKKRRTFILNDWYVRYSLLLSNTENKRLGRFTIAEAKHYEEAFEKLHHEVIEHLRDYQPFHWPLEFPEILIEDRQAASEYLSYLATGRLWTAEELQRHGFSAVLGNPPFQGGQKITGALGVPYRDYLVEHLANGKRGSADLCAYFFLRASQLIRPGGQMGLLATNTIAQGDTREVGLEWLAGNGFAIPRAVPSRPWPGLAAVEVAHVWAHRGVWRGPFLLDEQPVSAISPFLTIPGTTQGKPFRLISNASKSFQGSIVLGMGFILAPEEVQELIAKNPHNRNVLFPYLNGEDLNSRHDQSPSRWVINFFDWPLEQAATYSEPFAIVKQKVKPERELNNRKVYRDYWWHYAEKRPALLNTIAGMERVLTITIVSRTVAFAFVPNNQVYAHKLAVFPFDDYAHFSIMQSGLHYHWAWQYSSTMKSDLNYSPADVFETFPFPASLSGLDTIGESYYEHRRQTMLARQEGLTKTYNRFHAPAESSADITELRRLHVAMDEAVAAVYGWADLDLGHGFHQTKQGLRYTISEAARRTVLDRLLTLNHQRYAEEVAQGLHDKGAKKTKGQMKHAAKVTPSLSETPQLSLDFGDLQVVESAIETKIIDVSEIVQQRAIKKVAEERATYESKTSVPTSQSEAIVSVSAVSPLDRHVILLARVIQRHRQHGYEKTLGHVKAEKIAHIIEAHCDAELGRSPVREAAGPADFQRLLDVAARGKHLGAFQDKQLPGDHKAYQFAPLGGLKQMASRMEEAFDSLVPQMNKVIDLFVGLKTNEAEIVATLYAAWNDLLADGEVVSEERLFQEFFGWSKSKRNFQLGELRRMKAWMEAVRLVPTGRAKRTLQREDR